MPTRIFLLLLFVLILPLPGLAQSRSTLTLPKATPTQPNPPPGNIQLLDGYTHTKLQGIDTAVGRISKPGGMTIKYDNGAMAGQLARKCWAKDACRWFKRQVVGGREVWLGLTHNWQIIATFPKEYANFYAETKSPDDIADFLIMILTYRVGEVTPAPSRSLNQRLLLPVTRAIVNTPSASVRSAVRCRLPGRETLLLLKGGLD